MLSNRILATSCRTLALAAVLTVGLGSCASIVKGKTEKVDFRSIPVGANVSVTDEDGTIVLQAVTPCSGELRRGTGYFSSATYDVVFEKDGFDSHHVELSGRVNGWYIGGNLVFGGLIGWFILDPITGGMYTLAKDPVEVELTATAPGT